MLIINNYLIEKGVISFFSDLENASVPFMTSQTANIHKCIGALKNMNFVYVQSTYYVKSYL